MLKYQKREFRDSRNSLKITKSTVGIIKNFSQFINESVGDHYHLRALDMIPAMNTELLKLLDEYTKQKAHMTGRTYWYNRESRNLSSEHYAVDVKTYQWPDVDDWREAIGDPDADEETMFNHWYQYLEMEIEDYSSHFLEEFPEFDSVAMGGKSGGWMLIVPDKGPEYLDSDIDTYLDTYTEKINDLDEEDLDAINKAYSLSDEEREQLTELGLMNIPDEMQELITERDELIKELKSAIETLKRHEVAYQYTMTKHQEWEKEVKENFLESEKENYDL